MPNILDTLNNLFFWRGNKQTANPKPKFTQIKSSQSSAGVNAEGERIRSKPKASKPSKPVNNERVNAEGERIGVKHDPIKTVHIPTLWDRILSGITNDAKIEQEREKSFHRIESIKPPSQMSLPEKFDYYKRIGDWENLEKLYRAHPELIRAYDSQQEIVNHKKKHNVTDSYVIVDKNTGNEYITDSKGNTTQYRVATGQHKQDEFKVFPKDKTPVDKEWYPRQTASGIFKARYVSDYKYAGLPGYFTMDDITNSPYSTGYAHQALHGIPIHMKPNTPYKDKLKSEGYRKGLSAIKRGETITAGCIRNTDEAMQNLYSTLDSTNSRRDTVYVLPNNPNAGIIESGHQLVYLHPDQTKPATKDGRKLVYVQRPKIKKKKPTTWDKIKYWLGSH